MEAEYLQLSWRRAVVAVVGTLSGFFVCICEKLRAGENLVKCGKLKSYM